MRLRQVEEVGEVGEVGGATLGQPGLGRAGAATITNDLEVNDLAGLSPVPGLSYYDSTDIYIKYAGQVRSGLSRNIEHSLLETGGGGGCCCCCPYSLQPTPLGQPGLPGESN